MGEVTCTEGHCHNSRCHRVELDTIHGEMGQIHKPSDFTAPQGAALARSLKSIKPQSLPFIIAPPEGREILSYQC